MPGRKKERDLENTFLSLRLTYAQAVRFWNVMDSAKKQDAYADKADVIRELLGLDPPKLLTADEIHYFRTGEKLKK